MTLHDQLVAIAACRDAVEWVGTRPIEQAWAECERGDWMLWLSGKIDIDRKLIVLAACACAEPALAFVPAGEDRPRRAIEVARAWCADAATLDDVRANAANAAYAVDAYAAAYAAANAANAADAATAAAYAANAAAAAAANAAANAAYATAAAAAASAAAYAAYAAAAASAAASAASAEMKTKIINYGLSLFKNQAANE